jgi:tRNA (uracil-5-)-methyltransferase
MRHWGAETLDMGMGKRTLAVGPNTFFQNNVHLLLPLLDDVKSSVVRCPLSVVGESNARDDEPTTGTSKPMTVADLYGGVGTIALHLADQVGRVTCVESVEESARLAERNVAANSVENVEVVAADVMAFLRQQTPGRFDVVVADPPRSGLGPDVCRELVRIGPRRLVYVSCNALTQIEDARALAEGYHVTELRGYDMFPQTPHMEALAVFQRK